MMMIMMMTICILASFLGHGVLIQLNWGVFVQSNRVDVSGALVRVEGLCMFHAERIYCVSVGARMRRAVSSCN